MDCARCYCGAAVPPDSIPSPVHLRRSLELGVLAACAALAAAAPLGCDTGTEHAGSEAQRDAPPRTYAVGDVARATGYDLQVHRLSGCAPSPYLPSKASSFRLGLEVSVTNRGSEGLQVNPFYARLEDGSSRDYYFTLDGCSPALEATRLGPGESTKGWITFNVSRTASDLTLRYGPLSVQSQPLGSVEVALGDAAAVHAAAADVDAPSNLLSPRR